MADPEENSMRHVTVQPLWIHLANCRSEPLPAPEVTSGSRPAPSTLDPFSIAVSGVRRRLTQRRMQLTAFHQSRGVRASACRFSDRSPAFISTQSSRPFFRPAALILLINALSEKRNWEAAHCCCCLRSTGHEKIHNKHWLMMLIIANLKTDAPVSSFYKGMQKSQSTRNEKQEATISIPESGKSGINL